MRKAIWKSIGSIFAGFLIGAILSIGTDVALNGAGLMNMANFKENSSGIILIVIMYRFIFNIVGCYVTAKLAPNKPMKHVLIIGIIGTIFAILGSAAMWDKAVVWYNISIILISMPSAWIGAKLYMKRNPENKINN